MAKYRVTVSLELIYDTDEGIVDSADAARADAFDCLLDGTFSPSDFDVDVEEVE